MADEQNPTTKKPAQQQSGSGQGGSGQPPGASAVGSGGDVRGSDSGRPSGAERDRRNRLRTVTEQAGEELEALGVDPRLDNRVGDQRPVLNPVLKPQQFDGPEVGHFGEHADDAGSDFEEAIGRAEGEVIGMRSLGPLGRGEDDDEADKATRTRAELNR